MEFKICYVPEGDKHILYYLYWPGPRAYWVEKGHWARIKDNWPPSLRIKYFWSYAEARTALEAWKNSLTKSELAYWIAECLLTDQQEIL